MRQGDLTQGPVMKTMLRFAVPMILGNLLQQCYNVADTLIVGRFLGPDALAAVGSAFTLMTVLSSILLGLCLGSGAVFSIRFGQRDEHGLKEAVFTSFVLIAAVAAVKRELGGKWATIMVVNQCVVAWVCALLVRLVAVMLF